ncbi:hypothetical protein [Gordonia sihwensis]|uniref:hypothetical protein n=1 Tax=Gordonia sihwensis TaxID=173559 RepID=UPI0005F0B72B|nr:hypothetical protein [Gordonia sihwensis]KJR10583.1 hypothetical protein UG54_00925 [Gordonia sihwensis]
MNPFQSFRRPQPAIDHAVMRSFLDHPVELTLASGQVITGGVVKHVGSATAELHTPTGAVVVNLHAIDVVRSLVPDTACSEFPLPTADRTGRPIS